MFERRLCSKGHLTTYTCGEERLDIKYWTCPICSSECAWHDEGLNRMDLEPAGGFVGEPTYKIPIVFIVGNWYKTTDSPYKCISLEGMFKYPVILQTLSGSADCCDLRGLNPNSFKYQVCDEPHDCVPTMIVTTSPKSVVNDEAVINVAAQCMVCKAVWVSDIVVRRTK